ncbi:MAG: hypothetical protein HYT73_00830 [Candidatus Aenigmarchaeota archaeon]|nr:hypothetical protein [Candidatus Aenigmarchaeota archaeon]
MEEHIVYVANITHVDHLGCYYYCSIRGDVTDHLRCNPTINLRNLAVYLSDEASAYPPRQGAMRLIKHTLDTTERRTYNGRSRLSMMRRSDNRQLTETAAAEQFFCREYRDDGEGDSDPFMNLSLILGDCVDMHETYMEAQRKAGEDTKKGYLFFPLETTAFHTVEIIRRKARKDHKKFHIGVSLP